MCAGTVKVVMKKFIIIRDSVEVSNSLYQHTEQSTSNKYRILHECSCLIEFINELGKRDKMPSILSLSQRVLIISIIQYHEFRFYILYDIRRTKVYRAALRSR